MTRFLLKITVVEYVNDIIDSIKNVLDIQEQIENGDYDNLDELERDVENLAFSNIDIGADIIVGHLRSIGKRVIEIELEDKIITDSLIALGILKETEGEKW